MSKLVVNQVQYNGGQVFTLPTTAPAAGDFLKTDGSGALGWTGGNTQIKSVDGSSKTYTMPANSGSSGQIIKTDGNAQLSYAAPAGQNPMARGTNDGMVLIGNSGDEFAAGSFSSHTITCPTEYTTTPSDIIGWKIDMHGVRTGGQAEYFFSATDQAGNVINQSTNGSVRVGVVESGASYQTGIGAQGGYFNQSSTAGQMMIGVKYQNWSNYNQDWRTNNGGSNYWRNEGTYAEFWVYNRVSKPQWHGWAGYRMVNNDYGFNLTNLADPTTFSNSYGFPRNEERQTVTNHPMGWKLSTNGNNFVQGVWQVYAVFKDGVI